jgi:hypothetical protein
MPEELMAKEQLGKCEVCLKAIIEGDLHYYTSDGVWLCEEHSPMLSDAIRQHDDMFSAGAADFIHDSYDSFDEMAHARLKMKQEYQERGDRWLASN